MKLINFVFLISILSIVNLISPAHAKNLDIYPGVGISNISIGALKHKVYSELGKPESQTDNGDAYPRYGIYFHYENDRISSIIITSPRYRTDSGISTNSTPEQFINNYKNYKKTCYRDSGASTVTLTTMYDAIEEGLSFSVEKFVGKSSETIASLTVHRPGTLSTIYGEIFKCE